jgi:hypothetical protein
VLDQRQNKQFRAALLQFTVEQFHSYMLHSNI